MHLRASVLAVVSSFLPRLLAQSTFFCSTQNTGATFTSIYAQFQSKGACSETCASYSFAIVQGAECWCSNYFPSSRASSSLCDTPCPGYDSDNCGGTLNGAYGYYQLAQASGTAVVTTSTSRGSTSSSTTSSTSTTPTTISTSTTSTSPPTSVAPVTVVVTQTATPKPASTSSTVNTSSSSNPPSSSSSSPQSTASSKTHSSTTSATASNTSVASAQPFSQQSEEAKQSTGFFDSPGKVAGTFVAVGLIIAGLAAGAFFILLRRRQRRRSDSVLAASGLKRETSSASTAEAQSAVSQDDRSRSDSAAALMGQPREKNVSSGGRSPTWMMDDSTIVPVDQRLNPRPMLMRFDSNYSRHSLRDEEDYSRRVLTVANPETD